MSNDAFTINVKGLDQLLKALKAEPPIARIGILGTSGHREAKPGEKLAPTNAEIGAAHEFGSPARGLPQRSFLRMPITDRLEKEMEASGALDKDTLASVIEKGSVLPWIKKVAVTAEGIVADAFASGGFGKWPAWKSSNYSNKAGQLLVDTQQLRNSITSEVKE